MRRWITIAIVIALAVGGFFIYRNIQQNRLAQQNRYQTETAARGSLTALVGATGTVRANQTTLLGWQTTGRIRSIAVDVGDDVQAGDVLSDLESSSLPQSIILAQADLIAARRTLDELQSSSVAQANARLQLAQAEDALEEAQKNRERKDYARSSQTTIDAAQADYILAQNQVEKAEEAYNGVADRGEDDTIRASALSALSAARKARDRALSNLNYLLGKPDDMEVAQADAELAVAEANLADAQREWERLKDGPDPEDVQAAEARVSALEATLDMVQIKAPFSGTVTEVSSMVGDMVSPGTVSFRIDDLSRLLVDVEVPEVDINRIQVGQPARLTFDAIQGQEYTGEVVKVARVGSVEQGIVNFLVTVQIENAGGDVLPAMTSAVNVVVNQLDDVLLVPNRAVRLREGQRIVYVLENNQPTPVDITIGATSETVSEVASGDLKEGDLIVLNPPADFQGAGGGGPFMR